MKIGALPGMRALRRMGARRRSTMAHWKRAVRVAPAATLRVVARRFCSAPRTRAALSVTSPIWFSPRVRTQTTPDLPLEFSFSPITVDSDRSVSPG